MDISMENIDWNTVAAALISIAGGGGGLIAVAKRILTRALKEAKEQAIEIDAIRQALLGLTMFKLIAECEGYLKRGYCTINERKSIETLYLGYHSLGGNGVVTALYHSVMQLPFQYEN